MCATSPTCMAVVTYYWW